VRRSAPRAGDPAVVIAAVGKIRTSLGWVPAHDSLDGIVRQALKWEERLSGMR
jgi:UDP-glucose 4-epimerase